MDSVTLEVLVAAAIPRGIAGSDLLDKVRHASEISALPASRPNLLRVYRRRLKHTGGDLELLRLTEELVDFLAAYAHDELVMIEVSGRNGYHTFLLADRESSEILHWMRMFGEWNRAPGNQ
ncbi:hypothetical protein ACFWU5_09330 [Nocardia sp. NPDC058640]|uniref:hypothetical protein n=1 Tax=Nocardia sp. NPDC058640 TaxID=3346571 RepID=UPI00364798D3